MKIRSWFNARGMEYVAGRGCTILKRYGIGPGRAQKRISAAVEKIVGEGGAPTFPTPGSVVDRYPGFIRGLQDMTAEIAVHGYDHVDMKAYPPGDAVGQLEKAVRAFGRNGIEVRGFRCPYLSGTDALVEALPKGLFRYGSNSALRWDAGLVPEGARSENVLRTIEKLYSPKDGGAFMSLPWLRGPIVEIPVTVPDDLQLHDGWGLDGEGMATVWTRWLRQAHRRGELFDLMFHPELVEVCLEPLLRTLREARALRPAIWVASLGDVGDWWRERSQFEGRISELPGGLRIYFEATRRATILVRGVGALAAAEPWDGIWNRWRGGVLEVLNGVRPFVGLASGIPAATASFLREMGYVLDVGPRASSCSVFLDEAGIAALGTRAGLLERIEGSGAPLVRIGPWPDGAKSAFCISGDLDGLSLLDYLMRLTAS